MLISGAALLLPFAIALEGIDAAGTVLRTPMLIVLLVAITTFVTQYAAFFRLQQIAGPVYLSQIGSVAAVVGSPVAVFAFSEHLPDGFALAAMLIAAGLALFQYRAMASL